MAKTRGTQLMNRSGRFFTGRLAGGRFTLTGGESIRSGHPLPRLDVTATGSNALSLDLSLRDLSGTVLVYVSQEVSPPSRARWLTGSGADAFARFELSGAPERFVGLKGLAAETEYHVHLAQALPDGSFQTVHRPVRTPALDMVAPMLSIASVEILGETELAAIFETDEMSGTIFWALSGTSRALEPDQIKIGSASGIVSHGRKTVYAAGPQTRIVMKANAGAEHWLSVVHEDAAKNVSSVFYHGPFTPRRVTPPVVTSVEMKSTKPGKAAVRFNTDTDQGTAFVVLSLSQEPPTPDQVRSGHNHIGAHSANSKMPVSSFGPQFTNVLGLISSADYWVHVVQEDLSGNLSAVATSFSAERSEGGEIYLSLLMDGKISGSVENALLEGGQADFQGGINAIAWSNDGSGSEAVSYRTDQGILEFIDGLTRISCVLKAERTGGDRAWVSLGVVDVGRPGRVSIDITPDDTRGRNRIGDKSPVFLETDVTDLGSGYFLFQTVYNGWDSPDRKGSWDMRMASDNGGDTIINSAAGDFRILISHLTFEKL